MPSNRDVSDFLKYKLKWHSASECPSENTVRDLRMIGQTFIRNSRAMAAAQQAGVLYGRGTVFDEYSKLTLICQRAKSADHLAFLAEYYLETMKRNTPLGQKPDVAAKAAMSRRGGDLGQASLLRDAVQWLFKKNVSVAWSAHQGDSDIADIIEAMQRPSSFSAYFPDGCVPEKTRSILWKAPPSLKAAIRVAKELMSLSPAARQILVGLTTTPPAGGIDFAVHLFQPLCKQDFETFREHLTAENNDTQNTPGNGNTAAPGTASKIDAASTSEAPASAEGASASTESVHAEAQKRANDVIAGLLTIASPTSWTGAALTGVLKGKDISSHLGLSMAQGSRFLVRLSLTLFSGVRGMSVPAHSPSKFSYFAPRFIIGDESAIIGFVI